MTKITINGNEIDVDQPQSSPSSSGLRLAAALTNDAVTSNYILVKTQDERLNADQIEQLEETGAEIQEFISPHAYLCGYKPPSLNPVRALSFVDGAYIYDPNFVVNNELKTGEEESPYVQVTLHDDVAANDYEKVSQDIAEAAHIAVDDVKIDDGTARIRITKDKLQNIADIDTVKYINPTPRQRLLNNVATTIMQAGVPASDNVVYKGKGQIVCVADTGFDTGDPQSCHQAFQGRVEKLYSLGRPTTADDPDGHGTHVCGSVLGVGSLADGTRIEAPASEATLHMQSVLDADDGLGGITSFQGLFRQAYDGGARIHTNSWGSGPGPYRDAALEIDTYLWGRKDLVVLFAAGNEGVDKKAPLGKVDPGSIGREASAKNCIAVGASESKRPDITFGDGRPLQYGRWRGVFDNPPLKADDVANNPDGLAAFSSRGPTTEKRYKPDVVAPGTCILSARSSRVAPGHLSDFWGMSPDPAWLYEGGTSMACPLAAGSCAVIRGCLVDHGTAEPSAALIKALLINGAVEIEGQYTLDEITGSPNNDSGFGRVNLQNSLASIVPADAALGGFGDEAPGLTNRSKPFELPPITIPESGVDTLKITLVWTDFKGASLQNDLDLIVTDGTVEKHGNMGDGSGFDRNNNVEQIVWKGVTPGKEYKASVKVFGITSGPQPFAYAWRLY